MRDAAPFSSFEKPLSKGKRNRELDSVHLSQMEKDRILSEQKNLHEFLEKKADRAFQGEFAAQTRLSEAQAELDRKEWLRRSADIALCETGRQLESQRVGNFIKQINCLIRLKGRRAGQVKNYR